MATTLPLYPPTIVAPDQPLPLHRVVPRFLRNPLLTLPQQAYEQPIVVYRAALGMTVAWVAGPELSEEVLQNRDGRFAKTAMEKRVFRRSTGESVLTADGERWRWQRRVMAPLFRHAELVGYVPTMAAVGDELVARWRRDGDGRRAIDQDMTDATFTVIARTMLAGGEPAESAAIKQAGTDYLSTVPWEMVWEVLRLPGWLPHPGVPRLSRTAGVMRRAVAAMIARRRAGGVAADDVLDRLLGARDPDSGRPMDDETLIDNLLTLLAAGHETTAKALTWTLYLLARAPEWQARVRREVVEVAGAASLTAEHVERLELTERVLKEAMRLYPPAPVIARAPLSDIELGGHLIPAQAQVVIPIYCIHRHRQLWADPDRFDPDRFVADKVAQMPRTQYMPFGAGARTCLGMSFAMLEAKALLATFVRGAKFDWDGKHLPEPVSRVTLRPKGGMPLNVQMI